MKEIDWSHWRNLREIKVWEAVFLSFKINPDDHDPGDSAFDDFILENDAAIAKRLRLVKDHMSNREFFSPGILNCGDSNLNGIKLPEFALWCIQASLPIPAELSTLSIAKAQEKEKRETSPTVDEIEEAVFAEVAFTESVNNGRSISWRYWVHQMPTLTAAQAARLMCALDPDIFENLDSRPNRNDPSDLTLKAKKIQRLAETQGLLRASPVAWLEWAILHKLKVHIGFRIEVTTMQKDTALTLNSLYKRTEAYFSPNSSCDMTTATENEARATVRHLSGRYTLQEAAYCIGADGEERPAELLMKLTRDVQAGNLPAYEPGRNQKYRFGPDDAVREWYEEIYWDDLNQWLAKNEQRNTFRFLPPTNGSGKSLLLDEVTPKSPAVTSQGIPADTSKPWLITASHDPAPEQDWYTPARYFARQLALADATLLTKRDLLAQKVAKSLVGIGEYGRGKKRKKPLSYSTVKKALVNVQLF